MYLFHFLELAPNLVIKIKEVLAKYPHLDYKPAQERISGEEYPSWIHAHLKLFYHPEDIRDLPAVCHDLLAMGFQITDYLYGDRLILIHPQWTKSSISNPYQDMEGLDRNKLQPEGVPVEIICNPWTFQVIT